MIRNRKIELLAPARNCEVGVAAINHGADAVYIGPDRFGARVAASNSVSDIEQLARYAHRYNAKVYATVNTILYDAELDDARRLVCQLYDAGVDALIVQDMALLQMDLPPIALHASTQCDNRTLERVLFLQNAGFEQVVLARETPLDTMRHIAQNTDVALEAFVHGALCVSYSGRCYMSQAVKGRSANRGECAQMCRLPYTLTDEQGRVLAKDKHLLSLKDFDASQHLSEMIAAGISSFKIEGRLKDGNYVKNITAYYRSRLDAILGSDAERSAASLGRTAFFFTPDPKKTFFRGATDYFLAGRKPGVWSFDTPKSMGEPVGRVRDVWRNAISVNTKSTFANGDGLCFLNHNGNFVGFRVNRVEQGRLVPFRMPDIKPGTALYRNADAAFEKILAGKTAQRRIPVAISVAQEGDNLLFTIAQPDGLRHSMRVENPSLDVPQNPQRAAQTWHDQLSRLGNTIYVAESVDITRLEQPWFVPASLLNSWRDRLVAEFDAMKEAGYKPLPLVEKKNVSAADIPVGATLDYTANVANGLSRQFYLDRGAKTVQPAFELEPDADAELMRTRHCIRYAMGWCPKAAVVGSSEHQARAIPPTPPYSPKNQPEQLFIQTASHRFSLHFDCANCEMVIKKA